MALLKKGSVYLEVDVSNRLWVKVSDSSVELGTRFG
jgi:hypothetical protein